MEIDWLKEGISWHKPKEYPEKNKLILLKLKWPTNKTTHYVAVGSWNGEKYICQFQDLHSQYSARILAGSQVVGWRYINLEETETVKQEKTMEDKEFKTGDNVIYRTDTTQWTFGYYSHWDNISNSHCLVGGVEVKSEDFILAYEGNEHLLGTIKEPKEKNGLKKGDLIVVFDNSSLSDYQDIRIQVFDEIDNYGTYQFITKSFIGDDDAINHVWKYCVPYDKFNLRDRESTEKEILTIKNGEIVKLMELKNGE